MAEPTVQVPVSLIERALKVADILYPDGLPVREELRALLSHPTPSAEPPNIADMAPGTTGLSVEDRLHLASHLRLRAAQIRRGYVGATSAIGNLMGRAADAIDPSTNRDVQEPPTTPEVN